MTLNNNLKILRLKNNLTQQELGDILRVSDKTVSSWENKRSNIDVEMLCKIADTFNVSIDCLVNEDLCIQINSTIKRNSLRKKIINILLFFQMFLIVGLYLQSLKLISCKFLYVVLLISYIILFCLLKKHKIISITIFTKKKRLRIFLSCTFINVAVELAHLFCNVEYFTGSKSFFLGVFIGKVITILLFSIFEYFIIGYFAKNNFHNIYKFYKY